MKRNLIFKTVLFAFAVSVVLTLAGMTSAATSKTEKKLGTDITAINKMGSEDKGGAVVMQRLEKEFNVTDTQITSLRDQKLGYGEISTVFALAQKMGGITDANISKIMTLRQGPPVMGWGEIAKKLDLKLGSVVSSVHKVESSSERMIAQEEKTDHGGMDRTDRMDRMDRTDRPTGGHLR